MELCVDRLDAAHGVVGSGPAGSHALPRLRRAQQRREHLLRLPLQPLRRPRATAPNGAARPSSRPHRRPHPRRRTRPARRRPALVALALVVVVLPLLHELIRRRQQRRACKLLRVRAILQLPELRPISTTSAPTSAPTASPLSGAPQRGVLPRDGTVAGRGVVQRMLRGPLPLRLGRLAVERRVGGVSMAEASTSSRLQCASRPCSAPMSAAARSRRRSAASPTTAVAHGDTDAPPPPPGWRWRWSTRAPTVGVVGVGVDPAVDNLEEQLPEPATEPAPVSWTSTPPVEAAGAPLSAARSCRPQAPPSAAASTPSCRRRMRRLL